MECHWKSWETKETSQCRREGTVILGPCNPPLPYCVVHARMVQDNREWLQWKVQEKLDGATSRR